MPSFPNFFARLKAVAALLGLAAAFTAAGCATISKQNTVYLIRIEKGDTLAGIARKYDTSWEQIAALNGYAKGAVPTVGEVLRVAPGPGGLVAGAAAAPPSAIRLARRLPGRTKAEENASGDPDLGFTADDIPSEDGKTRRAAPAVPAAGPGAPKAKGLLFDSSGDDDGAAAGGSRDTSAAFFHWPVKGEVSSPFGWRGRKHHDGIDIRAKYGTDLLAAGPGIVEFVGNKRGYGKTVIIRHGQWHSLYGHLSTYNVSQGDHLTRATVIGQIGTSGNASGPHVHFEIRNPRGQAINPKELVAAADLISSN